MATSVTITGTGSPIPDPHRAGPGALVRYDDITMQFDVGRSTVLRLTGTNLWIPDLTAVFIPHHHSDHLTGLADLVLTYWTMDRTDESPPLTLVAPAGPAGDYVATVLDGWDADIEVRALHAGRNSRPALQIETFPVPGQLTEVWRRGDVVVSSMQVRHEPCPDSVGYRVDTPDGSVAITGDTRVCDEVVELARGVDVLVYEAMRFSAMSQLPPHRHYVMDYHADCPLIGAQAAELGVPTLILTHLIPAPRDEAGKQTYIDEVRSGGYDGEIIVADDLASVPVGDAGMPSVTEIGDPSQERDDENDLDAGHRVKRFRG